jgi:hypothetical protein
VDFVRGLFRQQEYGRWGDVRIMREEFALVLPKLGDGDKKKHNGGRD